MCLLTFLPPGVAPDTQALLQGALTNDDGHGFAIVAGDQLIVKRGLDAENLIEAFAAVRARHPEGPALFHSRLSTHGEISLDNCHPFTIGNDPRTVLAHNGILPAAVQPAKGDPRSDTRIAAEDVIPSFGSLRTRRIRQRLQRWITPRNKIVILSVDRRFKQPYFILNEASGIWDGGIWYSNDGYLPLPPNRWRMGTDDWDWPPEDYYGPTHGQWPDWREDDFGRCGNCKAIIDPRDGRCPYCGWCQDCQQMPGHCFCYTPAALDD